MKRIAAVAVPRDIDKTFDYAIPEEIQDQIATGMRVEVPFREDVLTAFVVETKAKSDFKGKLSPIRRLVDSERVLDDRQLQLALWISQYYISPLGIVLPAMVPTSLGIRSRAMRNYVQLAETLEQVLGSIESSTRAAPQQANLLKALLTKSETPLARDLLDEVGSTSAPLKSLERKGLVKIVRRPRPIQISGPFRESAKAYELTRDQKNAIRELADVLDRRSGAVLLHGVNASGKTEVYINAVEHCLSLGRQAIVLVPEISLTPQLISRFSNRFGERLAAYHSQLTEAERDHEWSRIHEGDADVVVGVRSAVFAPLERLGLIIIDEEHEYTYKQDEPAPRYHARDVAVKRAELESAVVLLGSATPSLESYCSAQLGELKLLEMTQRATPGETPVVKIVDQLSQKAILSPELARAIEKGLDAREQILLLLNLRGFSRAALCKRCREVQRCPSCRLSLVYHFKEQRLVCHLCSKSYPVGKCRDCQSDELIFLGFGTEQAEHEIREAFPGAQLARMDSDVMGRGAYGEVLEDFRSGKIDILLGTQMIGLGLDFPNVTLVGVLSADSLINIPDFRAGERTFQLLSQAIGRSGRGSTPGEVIIQTSQPDIYALRHAAQGSYKSFYEDELEQRKLFEFPPFSRLIKITCEGRHEESVESECKSLYSELNELQLDDTEILEPMKAQPHKLRGDFRWRLVVKTKKLHTVSNALREVTSGKKTSVQIKIDVDPSSLVF